MTIQVEFTWLVGLLVMFVLAVWALGKVLIGQFEKRLDERFVAQEETRKTSQAHWELRFTQLEALARETESSALLLQSEMAHKVAQLDYVRNQSIIEAKLDALWSELKIIQVKGTLNGHG